MFKALWNNFYNWAVRDASPVVRGGIIFVLFVLGVVSLMYSIKKGKDGKPVGNWLLFWFSIIILFLAIGYTILQAI